MVERHFDEVQTRYSLVKGERIVWIVNTSAATWFSGVGSHIVASLYFVRVAGARISQFVQCGTAISLQLHFPAMSDEQLKLLASSTINGLFSSGKVTAPISSMDLLTRVISAGPPNGLFPTPAPRFRLIDLAKFESILESLSQDWNHGEISLSREDGGSLTIMDVHLGGNSGDLLGTGFGGARKRKRVVDEDADSAAGSEPDDDSFEGGANGSSTTLGNLSKELKEVYTILQKSTAKGRLLAEQVCIYHINIIYII